MKIIRNRLFVLMVLTSALTTWAGESITMRNPTLSARVAEIKGLNLGNALEAPAEGDWGVTLSEQDFVLIAQADFNTLRIPVRWSAHALQEAPYTIDPQFFARVDWVVEQASQHRLLALINVHHYDELCRQPEEHEDRYLALWHQIAEHYAQRHDNELWFELLNEPNNNLQGLRWEQLMQKAWAVVRTVNTTRPIVVGGDHWNAYNRLADLTLPEDDNLVLTFHYYQPFHFTHQGAGWVDNMDRHLGTTWDGTEAEQAEIEAHFAEVSAVQKATGLPVILGEFGAYSKAPMDSRVRWTAEVTRTAERHGFGWMYWEFCSGFGVYDSDVNQWRTGLLKALTEPDAME